MTIRKSITGRMYKHKQKAALRDIGIKGIFQPVLRSVSDQWKIHRESNNMKTPPDVYAAEPIPSAAESEIKAILESGDLFRYSATEGAPGSGVAGFHLS